jgi:hypothetical protein
MLLAWHDGPSEGLARCRCLCRALDIEIGKKIAAAPGNGGGFFIGKKSFLDS